MSVVRQAGDVPLEILVGDDHSEDGTSDTVKFLADKYPDIIRYFRHPERLGYGSKNYQELIREARGKYIAHLDGDDFWLPGKLAAQVDFLENNLDCPAVYSNAQVVDETGNYIGLFNNPQPLKFDINALLRRGSFLNHSSICYRSALKKNILAMQAPFLDYSIHLSLACHGPVGYLDHPFVGYRVNSSTSIIVHANERIRKVYWQALMNVPKDCADSNALAGGMAEFARSAFFRSLRIRKLSLLRQWLPVVLDASPVGKPKMVFLILSSIFRVGVLEGYAAWLRKLGFKKMKILYRR